MRLYVSMKRIEIPREQQRAVLEGHSETHSELELRLHAGALEEKCRIVTMLIIVLMNDEGDDEQG